MLYLWRVCDRGMISRESLEKLEGLELAYNLGPSASE